MSARSAAKAAREPSPTDSAVLEALLHDLSQPITALRGSLDLGLELSQTTEHYRQALEEALLQVDRLMELICKARQQTAANGRERKDKGPALSMEA